jgi:hypothetical protein
LFLVSVCIQSVVLTLARLRAITNSQQETAFVVCGGYSTYYIGSWNERRGQQLYDDDDDDDNNNNNNNNKHRYAYNGAIYTPFLHPSRAHHIGKKEILSNAKEKNKKRRGGGTYIYLEQSASWAGAGKLPASLDQCWAAPAPNNQVGGPICSARWASRSQLATSLQEIHTSL